MSSPSSPLLTDLRDCFEGAVPAVIATASADGTPNVTYLSRLRLVDADRVALSNQFFSKTGRNLVENPRASVLVLDPRSYEEYRLDLVYERTDRRGPVFDRLRADVDITAALQGMQDVFRLRTADIYRVTAIERLVADVHRRGVPKPPPVTAGRTDGMDAARIAELSARMGRGTDLDMVIDAALAGLVELFGYVHAVLMLHDEEEGRLFTIASVGYERAGVGSEVSVGDGVVGQVARRCAAIRLANAGQVAKYSRSVRQSYEDDDEASPGRDVPVPGLVRARSQVAVPAMAMGSLVGVLLVESADALAFEEADEAVLTAIGSVVASVIEAERTRERLADPGPAPSALPAPAVSGPTTHVRFFPVDGSVFVDGDYVIRGVAGRILASLLRQHAAEGRIDFTNREVRLDPSLELPAFRDNFDSRLILLKRRLDERLSTLAVEKTGRGRFRLRVTGEVELEVVDDH